MKTMRDRINNGEFDFNEPRPNKRYFEANGWEDQYREACQIHASNQYAVEKRFQDACLEDVGLTQHPNAEAIFAYAWQEERSSGLHEVYLYLCELSVLFFHKGKLLNAHQKD